MQVCGTENTTAANLAGSGDPELPDLATPISRIGRGQKQASGRGHQRRPGDAHDRRLRAGDRRGGPLRTFDGYWGYAAGASYAPGYLDSETVVHMVTNLYSLEQNKLLWSGVSKTFDPSSAQAFMTDVSKAVAKSLEKERVILWPSLIAHHPAVGGAARASAAPARSPGRSSENVLIRT